MESKKTLGMSRALAALREGLDYSDLPTQMVQMLLEVAAAGEISQQELEKRVGISRAAISRFLSILSVGSPLKPGLKVLTTYEDPEYRKRKMVSITKKGQIIVQVAIDRL